MYKRQKYVFPAYEDVYYYLWREHRLPANVDPFDSRLDDAMERARLAQVFRQGLDQTIGHVLPLVRRAQGGWQSGPWFLRDGRCYLVPGDSPIGYRLPLDSQPWVARDDYPYIHSPDPTQTFAALRPHAEIRAQHAVSHSEGLAAEEAAVSGEHFAQKALELSLIHI